MEKISRTLALCGIMTALFLGSCVSTTDELNLNKGLRLDMQIGPGGLYIPLGSLDTLFLESFIEVGGENSVLDTLDGGLFGFRMKDSIETVSVVIDSVKFKIDDPEIDPMTTSFDKPKVKNVNINSVDKTVVKISKVDLSNINLPSFNESDVVGPKTVPATNGATITPIEVQLDEQAVDCSFEYDFPEDVEKLNKIWFGQTKGSRVGQKLSLDINLSGVYSALTSPTVTINSLIITFPTNFTLGKDASLDDYISPDCVHLDGSNVFRIEMGAQTIKKVRSSDKMLPITFYVRNADFSDPAYDDGIDFNDEITYSVTMSVGGTGGSVAKTFSVNVNMAAKLKMADIDAITKRKEVDVEKDTISSICTVDGLAGISRVNTITFKPDSSLLYLCIGGLDIDPFTLEQATSHIDLTFLSDDLIFDQSYCKDEFGNDAGSWQTATKVRLDATKTLGHKVALKAQSLNVYQDVDQEKASIDIETDVELSGTVFVARKTDVVLADLDAMKNQTLPDTVRGKFVIFNSNVETGEKVTNFDDTTEISIGAPVDESVVMVKQIDFNPSDMYMHLSFDDPNNPGVSTVPPTIDTLYFSQFKIDLPDYLRVYYKYKPTDPGYDKRISVSDSNDIIINGPLNDQELHHTGFDIVGLEIKGMVFDEPKYTINDSLILNDQNVFITGDVTVKNAKINDNELTDIIVTPTVSFDSIKVNVVHGLVDPEIDRINEEVKLAMGDDADFFKNENNHLSLSDPKITIDLTSSITVPIDLNLKLTSIDTKGVVIGTDSAIIHLDPCPLDEDSIKTRLLIYNGVKQPVIPSDNSIRYKPVLMKNLSGLMERIPDKILFDLDANANQTVEHHVDLTRRLAMSGEYEVSIPLAFDSLYIEYGDTISDIGSDLGDIVDMIDAAEMHIAADVESTLPLGVLLTAKAYNKDWAELPNISIDSCVIAAGSDTVTHSSMVLGMNVQKVDNDKSGLADLEYIIFTAALQSAEGSSDIRMGQFLWLNKVRLQLPQGIKVDLTDDKKKK